MKGIHLCLTAGKILERVIKKMVRKGEGKQIKLVNVKKKCKKK